MKYLAILTSRPPFYKEFINLQKKGALPLGTYFSESHDLALLRVR